MSGDLPLGGLWARGRWKVITLVSIIGELLGVLVPHLHRSDAPPGAKSGFCLFRNRQCSGSLRALTGANSNLQF